MALSPVQAKIVECLIQNPGALVSRADLVARLSEEPSTPTRNALDLHVTRIRRKLTPLGLTIKAVRGRGYRLHAVED
ncbi:Response regulators consisting of a CheY-like receiver domain and a winged-helix DNA-binding domain [Marinactinospora thermotolerans DSM 45154]|uniref:Response regulators consisting of a CheY-like receiver domain and a winged-helix DNA-binding domain n=1 Tax=Marinactinospora thermotolerans DSM 45154 TaxID=1122192 RepID=A0A1T4KIE9_9ACTN|nr:Response regulators consisting of a CheY-like receiver domain and a winged-helix DNA-binding domain [Marinactinospora thermotolerans DSM 45154]